MMNHKPYAQSLNIKTLYTDGLVIVISISRVVLVKLMLASSFGFALRAQFLKINFFDDF